MAKILFFFSCWSRVYGTVLDLWAFWLFQFFITNCLGKWCLKIFFRKRSLGQKLLSMLICREMNQLQWQHRCWGLSPHPHPEFQKLYPGPALDRPEEQIYFRTFCTKSRRWGLGWSDFCCSLPCWMFNLIFVSNNWAFFYPLILCVFSWPMNMGAVGTE